MDTLLLNADSTPLSHVPLSVIPWKSAVRMYFSGKIEIVKDYDDWIIRSQKLEMKVPSIAIMIDQVKRSGKIKYNRMNVYLRDDFTCQLQVTDKCQTLNGKVPYHDLTLDHVIPKSHGGKTNWLNVCTSCKTCNSFKSDDASIVPRRKPHRPTYYEILAKRKKLPVGIKDAEWANYIDWPEELIKVLPRT